MTVAAARFESHIGDLFPLTRFGRYRCRRISGSRSWSQHSWPGGNARDVYAPDTDYVSGVVKYVRQNLEALSVRVVVWERADHYGHHAHFDFWPRGYRTPPCAGGTETYQYPNGRLVRATGGDVPPEADGPLPPPPFPPTRKPDHMFCEHKAPNKGPNLYPVKGPTVEYWQQRILHINPNGLPQWGADGDYGDETAAAVAAIIPDSNGQQIGPHEAAYMDSKYPRHQDLTLHTQTVDVVKSVTLG